MARPLKKWPHYALESAENTLALLKEIEAKTRRVQVAIQERDVDEALILLSDVRAASLKGVEHLVRAKTGNYEREADKWAVDRMQRVEMAR